MPEDFKVTPWEVTGDIDYDLLQQRFGTTPIDDALLERLSGYGELHYMLRRGIFYSHRDMIPLLDQYDKGNRFVLYTGRGPSGNTHLGHIMPWIFNKWVQDTFGVDMLFQLTDDEKFLFKDLTLEETGSMAYENALDFIALGFDPKKTRIIVNTKNVDRLYPVALKVAKKVTFSTAKAVFGFDNSTNIGSIFYTTMQSVPAFLPSDEAGRQVPVLIPCGIDQDPHFRVTRDVAPGLNYPKPSLIYCKMCPGLAGGELDLLRRGERQPALHPGGAGKDLGAVLPPGGGPLRPGYRPGACHHPADRGAPRRPLPGGEHPRRGPLPAERPQLTLFQGAPHAKLRLA